MGAEAIGRSLYVRKSGRRMLSHIQRAEREHRSTLERETGGNVNNLDKGPVCGAGRQVEEYL